MSRIVTSFDPSAATQGTFSANIIVNDSSLLILNESSYFLKLDLGTSGGQIIVQPWVNRLIRGVDRLQDISWYQAGSISPTSAPISICYVIAFDPSEEVSEAWNMPLQRLTNVGNPVQVNSATNTIERDLLTPFVLSGLVPSADGSVPNQLDVTAGIALLRQTDSSLLRQSLVSATFLTTAPSTTYFLDLNPDASWSFATSHSAQSNYMSVAQVTTNASGNITAVTDVRPSSTTLLSGYNGTVNAPANFSIPQGLFFQNAITPNDFSEINQANLGFLDIGVTAQSPSTDNPTILFILTKGASTFLPLAIGTPGLEPVGSWFDTAGVLHAGGSPVLASGNQETGAAGVNFKAASAGDVFAYWVNFKTKMTNFPSSITLTQTGTATNATVQAQSPTLYGFLFVITATAAGAAHWYGQYTTVGN